MGERSLGAHSGFKSDIAEDSKSIDIDKKVENRRPRCRLCLRNKLARNAEADYSTDECVKRFPKLERSKKDAQRHSLKALVAAWHAAALARDVRKRDAKRIKQRTEMFIDFRGHNDPTLVTKADIDRWADKRTAEGVTENMSRR